MTTQEAPGNVLALKGKLFATVPEVAAVLRSDVRSVRRAIAAGEIPGIRVGPCWRVPVTWLRHAAGLEPSEAGP
jgi:excisionase family DNA binding protein